MAQLFQCLAKEMFVHPRLIQLQRRHQQRELPSSLQSDIFSPNSVSAMVIHYNMTWRAEIEKAEW